MFITTCDLSPLMKNALNSLDFGSGSRKNMFKRVVISYGVAK